MRCFEVRLENKLKKTQGAECLRYIAALEKPQVQFRQRSRNSGSAGVELADHCGGVDPNTRGGASSGRLGVSQPGRLVSRSAAPSSLYDDSAINLEELFRTGPELWDSVSSLFRA